MQPVGQGTLVWPQPLQMRTPHLKQRYSVSAVYVLSVKTLSEIPWSIGCRKKHGSPLGWQGTYNFYIQQSKSTADTNASYYTNLKWWTLPQCPQAGSGTHECAPAESWCRQTCRGSSYSERLWHLWTAVGEKKLPLHPRLHYRCGELSAHVHSGCKVWAGFPGRVDMCDSAVAYLHVWSSNGFLTLPGCESLSWSSKGKSTWLFPSYLLHLLGWNNT